MKLNTEIIPPSNDYSIKNISPKSYPDIIEQVDKVINKYKNQLEQLKPKKDLNENNFNMQYYLYKEKGQNKYPKTFKNDSDQYTKNNPLNQRNNTYNCNYNYEEMKEEINEVNEPEKNIYNFNYRLNESKNNKERQYNKRNNLNNELVSEMEIDNIKLGSALTSEKAKVVQLLNLLKKKENEINNLKRQIDTFEVKINEIENKYQNIINTIEQQQSIKLNDLFNNLADEKNQLKFDFNEIKRNSEVQLEQANNELIINKKIIKIFFDLFNKNLELYNKTEILRTSKIDENNYTEENAYLASETIDKLINKLVQDNKDLFNELVRLKGEIDSNNIIMGQNNDFIQQENNSLKEMVKNLAQENNFLKSNKSYTNIRTTSNRDNYDLHKNSKTQANFRDTELNSGNHRHIVHSICRHCTPDCFRNNKNNNIRDTSPFEKLKIKIDNLENQIRNQTYT